MRKKEELSEFCHVYPFDSFPILLGWGVKEVWRLVAIWG